MQFKELKNNVSFLFQQDGKEDDAAYAFYLREALSPFKNTPGDLAKVWEQIKEYDGMKKRPNFGFFVGIASGARKSGDSGFAYYHCECGTDLSFSSDGGCPNCHNGNALIKRAETPIPVLVCKGSCFDCSIYSDKRIGPTCNDFGTMRYEDCKSKSQCKCQSCCRFEYKRTHHPERLREEYPEVLQTLPKPISAAGLAFHEGRADFTDINKYIERNAKKARA